VKLWGQMGNARCREPRADSGQLGLLIPRVPVFQYRAGAVYRKGSGVRGQGSERKDSDPSAGLKPGRLRGFP